MKNTIASRVQDFLKNYPPFTKLPKNTLFNIAKNVEILYFEENEVIFSQNDAPHKHFYIVNEGAIRLYRFAEGKKHVVDICDEGDLFGLRPLIMNENYLMGAAANEETIIYGIPIEDFNNIILNFPLVSQFLLASFATNTRNPFEDKHKGKLFANISAIKKVENPFSETQSVKYTKSPITCSKNTFVKEAATIMTNKVIDSIIVTENNLPIGIITDKDMRTKIGTGLHKISETVEHIMSSPVETFQENLSIAEAQIARLKHKVSHLIITKDGTPNTEIVGIITDHDLNTSHGNNPMFLMKEIKNARDAETLKYVRTKATNLTKGYLEQEIPIYFVTKVISEINNAITKKAIRLSVKEIGIEPPVKFSWFAVGSQGRQEQLLMTDQDNALVFENVPEKEYDAVKKYFLLLATKITEKLHIVGYEYCPANIMASNTKWCLSYNEWKAQFKDWIKNPIPKKILLSIIFFDFELIYGDKTLYSKLSKRIIKYIKKNQIFLSFLSKATLENPAPLGFFKQFLVEEDGENKDNFDIKSRAIRPLVDAARIFSLYHGIEENNTIARYEKLMEIEPQNKEVFESCANAFKILLQFRTLQGIANNDSGKYVDINSLSKADRLKLKSCFKPIKNIQDSLKLRFNVSKIT